MPSEKYLSLINRFPLVPISSEAQNEIALNLVSELQKNDDKSAEEFDYFRVLIMLIQEFETKTYDLGPDPSPAEMLEYMMEVHDMTMTDMVPTFFASEQEVNDVLAEKMDMTKTQIESLSKRFHVSESIFCKHCDCVRARAT